MTKINKNVAIVVIAVLSLIISVCAGGVENPSID